MDFYTKTTEQTLTELASTDKGLVSEEAQKRQLKYGKNLIDIKGTPLWRKLLEPFANIFVAVLVAAALLSLFTGHTVDAAIIFAIISVSAIIYYVQQASTERVLKALKRHEDQYVAVYRDGKSMQISAEDLVPGDCFVIAEGEKVPADARILHSDNIRVDEAMLTGESLPVNKHVHALQGEHAVYDRANMLFQGSFILLGRGVAVVTSIGAQTEFGRLAQLAVPSTERSPVQHKIDQLITKLITAIAIASIGVFGLAIYRGIEAGEALRFVMALAVSAVPEGLPVAITVVLVLGMRRLARYKALARSMKSIETIGIITTIASDKTGTLTKNKLSVQEVWQVKETNVSMGAWTSLAANASDGGVSDPLDTALDAYAKHDDAHVAGRTLVKSLPFDQVTAMSGNVWQVGDQYQLVIKGAPEKIIQHGLHSDKTELAAAEKALHHLTGLGYRVIAIAELAALKDIPESFDAIGLEDLKFVGLIAIADELRPEATQAIQTAQAAGITVRMITGDHAETAYAIGKKLGLVEHRDQVMDCRTIDQLSDQELTQKVQDIRVFARVTPDAKHHIVSILNVNHITAMTGDGVNDVPALTNAHVGVAMGSGSQIAKEASDIVLLDDNFASIVKAVEGGRVINDNIRRMLFYVLATSLGEVLIMTLALVAGLPLPVVAVQILWVNLVTDTAFAIPLGMEPAEDTVMKRPPRGVKQPILDGVLLQRLFIVALTMAAVGFGTFWFFVQDHDVDYARTIAFTVLVVMQWANAVNARSEFSSLAKRLKAPNPAFFIGFTIAALLQLVALFGPLAGPLHVTTVNNLHLLGASLTGFVLIIAVSELHKWYSRRQRI